MPADETTPEASETVATPTTESNTSDESKTETNEVKDETPQNPTTKVTGKRARSTSASKPAATSKVTGKRARSTAKGPVRVELPEKVFIEAINLLEDDHLPPEQQVVVLEILSRLEISIDILQKTKAGVCLRKLKKSSKDAQVQQLCQAQVNEYRVYVKEKLGKNKKTEN